MSKRSSKKGIISTMMSKAGGFIVITLAFAVLICVYPGNNIFTFLEARRDISRQESQMLRYQKQIENMQERIDQLTTSRDTLEKFARENFHFTQKDEDVYLIER